MPVPPTRPWPLVQSRPTCPQALAPARWLVSHARRAGVLKYPPLRVPSYLSCASPRRSRPESRSPACIAGCASPVWLPSDRALCPAKAARVHANRGPSPRLLVDGFPRRQVVWHIAPGGACAHDPSQSIEHLAQVMVALWGVFSNERQVRGNKRPLFVGNIAWVWFSSCHARMLPLPG